MKVEKKISNTTQQVPTDLLCFSHLGWDFVFQRPQHLLGRCGKQTNVYFWEEPIHVDVPSPLLHITPREGNVQVIVTHLPQGTTAEEADEIQRELLDNLIEQRNLTDFVSWYYSPMAVSFTRH